MARRETVGVGRGAGRGGAAVVGMARLSIRVKAFREGLREGLRRLGDTEQDVFREVWVAGAPAGVFGEASRPSADPGSARGVCVVLPDGVRIERLDVEGAAALARLLS